MRNYLILIEGTEKNRVIASTCKKEKKKREKVPKKTFEELRIKIEKDKKYSQ